MPAPGARRRAGADEAIARWFPDTAAWCTCSTHRIPRSSTNARGSRVAQLAASHGTCVRDDGRRLPHLLMEKLKRHLRLAQGAKQPGQAPSCSSSAAATISGGLARRRASNSSQRARQTSTSAPKASARASVTSRLEGRRPAASDSAEQRVPRPPTQFPVRLPVYPRFPPTDLPPQPVDDPPNARRAGRPRSGPYALFLRPCAVWPTAHGTNVPSPESFQIRCFRDRSRISRSNIAVRRCAREAYEGKDP